MDVYSKLAKHLDNLPEGFPQTESRVELEILRKLFTRDEAEIAVALRMIPETAKSIASRLLIDEIDLSTILESMSKKGLIFRNIKDNQHYYMAAQFVIGIWEYHVNDLDKELIQNVNKYMPFLSEQVWNTHKTKQLRVIPVSGSVSAKSYVMPYEKAEEIIKRQTKILIAPCICRKEHRIMGKGCQYPLETCFVFGKGAEYYEGNRLGRLIEQTEAINILKEGVHSGLVLQPGNSKKPVNICMCCGCCCQVLKNLKKQKNPARIVNSSWYASTESSACVGCGSCIEKCHMLAIKLKSNVAEINLDRCIGCGICTLSCDSEALKLFEKKPNERWDPPENTFETYLNIAKERGLIQ